MAVHVGRDVWGQKSCLQLTQRNVDQTELGACAVRQTAGTLKTASVLCFPVQGLSDRPKRETAGQPERCREVRG